MNEDPKSRSTPAARFAGLRPKLVALLVSTCVVLLVAEITVRRMFHDELDTELQQQRNRALAIGNLIESSDTPELHYQLKRGINEEWMNVLVATRVDIATRISTFAPPPENPAISIALIGDSSSFGFRIFYEGTYAFALRVALEKSFGAPVELRNYSVPGYNSIQERITLEQVLAGWNPDLVILHYDHNDPDPQSAAPPGYISPEYGDNLLGSALIKLAMRRLRLMRNQGLRIFVADDGTEEWLFGSLRSGGTLYEAHLDELRRMGRELTRRNIPAVAVIYEHGIERVDKGAEDYHYDALHTPLLPVLEESGFRVLDLQPEYQKLMRDNDWSNLHPFWVSEVDGHPNALGHYFIAKHLHRFLLEDPGLKGRLEQAATRPGAGPLDVAQNEAAAAFQQALVMMSSNRFNEAATLLRKALDFRPGDVTLRLNLAMIHANENRIGDAVAELEEVLRLKPDFFVAHIQLSHLYAYEGRFDDAMRHHGIVQESALFDNYRTAANESLAKIFLKLATNLAESGDVESAKNLLDRAATIFLQTGLEDEAARLRKRLENPMPNNP